MKNFFKHGFFVSAMVLSIASCSSSKTATSLESDPAKTDSASSIQTDTNKAIADSATLKNRRDSLPKGFNKSDSVR